MCFLLVLNVSTCHFPLTGAGAAKLAEAVLKAVEQPVNFKFLYDLEVGWLNYLFAI